MTISLLLEKVGKSFGDRKVIRELSFSVNSPGSVGITGKNGSGKTTLMKILAQLIPPSRGKTSLKIDDSEVSNQNFNQHLKMVSPELALYETLTGYENLRFFATVAGIKLPKEKQDSLLDLVGLKGRGSDMVASYSSGMKQRLKYAVALLAEPEILLLDEPMSNLDDSGKEIIRQIMAEQSRKGILVVATNESEDLRHVERVITLD